MRACLFFFLALFTFWGGSRRLGYAFATGLVERGRFRRGGFFILYNAILSHRRKQVKRYWKGILLIKAGVDYKCCGG